MRANVKSGPASGGYGFECEIVRCPVPVYTLWWCVCCILLQSSFCLRKLPFRICNLLLCSSFQLCKLVVANHPVALAL
jgi:hypothetical protein